MRCLIYVALAERTDGTVWRGMFESWIGASLPPPQCGANLLIVLM
jgi:hypothetical protein